MEHYITIASPEHDEAAVVDDPARRQRTEYAEDVHSRDRQERYRQQQQQQQQYHQQPPREGHW
jgi:hypothetical protein